MRWNEIMNEGLDYDCSNCGEHIGKASELPKGKVSCPNCGDSFNNPYGYESSRGSDEKFGRLAFTDVTNEEGCIQGVLKTSKGATLGSLIQYGPKWLDYDNGKWEAYCSAIKKRKKGFADKKKAVEWIVRQTRVVNKSQVSEAMGDPMVFGHTVPNWSHEDEAGDAAYFSDGSYTSPAQVLQRDGRWEVWFHSEDNHFVDSATEVEAILTKYGCTDYEGWEDFGPQRPHGMDESLNEAASFTGFDSIPDWTHENYTDTAPVAEYQKRTRYADRPLRALVFKNKGKFHIFQDDDEQIFSSPQKAAEWLDKNGFLDHVGVTQVNL